MEALGGRLQREEAARVTRRRIECDQDENANIILIRLAADGGAEEKGKRKG